MDPSVYFRFLMVLILVIAMIVAIAWLVRRFGLAGQLTPNRSRTRRLSVVEVTALDARRKLVLLRRDAVEYLVLLGPNQDLVLDAGLPSQAKTAGDETPPAATPPVQQVGAG